MGSLRRRLENLEKNSQPHEDDRERIKREIDHRISMGVLDELGLCQAAGGRRGGKGKEADSLAVQRYGSAYTNAQLCELAVNRAFDRLEKLLAPGYITWDDFREHANLTPEQRQDAVDTWLEAEKLRIEQQGEDWNAINRHERRRRQQAMREEWHV